MSNRTSETTTDDIFRPPPKGDITLRSSDGVEFQVHSAILGMASTVFESLSAVGTDKDVVEVSESAATMSLVLRFIYPNQKPPIITSFDALSRCLEAARKYDIESMLETLDDQLATKTSSQSLVHEDPLRTYELALQFNLPNTRALAVPLVITSTTDFSDPSQLVKLVQSHSPASVIRLAAIQSTRGKILADILFRFYRHPISSEYDTYMFYQLSCLECQTWSIRRNHKSNLYNFYRLIPPSWLLAWVDFAYETLLRESLQKSDELFDWSTMARFKGKENVCQQCLAFSLNNPTAPGLFNPWAQRMRDALRQGLEVVQHLYAL